jgi:hypothetical protein
VHFRGYHNRDLPDFPFWKPDRHFFAKSSIFPDLVVVRLRQRVSISMDLIEWAREFKDIKLLRYWIPRYQVRTQ